MLAFEKEHAVMRTKCTDDAVWERYKPVLEDNRPTTQKTQPRTVPQTRNPNRKP